MTDDYGKSIADIERVLAIEPRHFGALAGLGTILRELGEEKRALAAYRQALTLDPLHGERAGSHRRTGEGERRPATSEPGPPVSRGNGPVFRPRPFPSVACSRPLRWRHADESSHRCRVPGRLPDRRCVAASEPGTSAGAARRAIPSRQGRPSRRALRRAAVGANAGEGKAIERQIVVEWLVSGDDEIDTHDDRRRWSPWTCTPFGRRSSYLDKVVAAKPDYVEGWNKRATVYYYMDEYDSSLADIEKTLAIEPRHFGALAGLGMIMQDVGNMPGAIAAFERAVAVNPSLDNLKAAIEQLKARIGQDI